MNKEVIKNIQLGLFVILGSILLITGLYLIGSNRNMFSKSITLYASFKNVNGLQKGDNVRYSGIRVGIIKDIEIVNDTTIKVKMQLDAGLQKVIRRNAVSSIGTDGLMGSKVINIDPVLSEGEFIKSDDELASIASVNMEDMLRTLSVTNKNVMAISANLKTLTDNINSSRGTLYTVLMDTSLALKIHKTLDNIQIVSVNVKQLSFGLNEAVADVNHGKGVLGTMINDTSVANNLVAAINNVKSAGDQINSSALSLKQILQKVNTGDGTIGTLVNDTTSANSLKRSLLNIEVITQKFNEDLEALKHNFLFKAYFKKQEQKKPTGK